MKITIKIDAPYNNEIHNFDDQKKMLNFIYSRYITKEELSYDDLQVYMEDWLPAFLKILQEKINKRFNKENFITFTLKAIPQKAPKRYRYFFKFWENWEVLDMVRKNKKELIQWLKGRHIKIKDVIFLWKKLEV